MNVETFTSLFEPYDRKARLFPALLTLVPVFVVLIARYGQMATTSSGIGSILVAWGGLFWLSRVARNAGVAVQEKMWKSSGGVTPTVRYLRHSNGAIELLSGFRLAVSGSCCLLFLLLLPTFEVLDW